MARREYPCHFRCAEKGCSEVTDYYPSTRHDEAELLEMQKRSPFRCTRHAHPERNLRPGNTATSHVLVAGRRKLSLRAGMGLPAREWWSDPCWIPEGDTGGTGFVSGPGFNAHAEDFPEGTRLVVTARIELPERTEGEKP